MTRAKVGLLHAAAGTEERKEVYEVLWSGQDGEMKSSDTSKMWAPVSSSIQGRRDITPLGILLKHDPAPPPSLQT